MVEALPDRWAKIGAAGPARRFPPIFRFDGEGSREEQGRGHGNDLMTHTLRGAPLKHWHSATAGTAAMSRN